MPSRRKEIREFLTRYHPVLIEGPGPSDRRDPEDVVSQVALNVSSHIAYVYKGNASKDLLLISQGDPPDTKGISAVSNLFAARLNINKCVVCLDEDIDPDHSQNADRERKIFEVKYSEMVDILKEETEHDYYSIVNEVEKKLKECNSADWVEKYTKLQEVTKVTMKKICGSVTVVHTVANPDSFSVTRFYSVGLNLQLIDAEKEMTKYHSALIRLLQVKNFDAAEKFLFDESEISSDDQTQNVLFIDDEYQNTVLIAAVYYGAPLSFLEKAVGVGGQDLPFHHQNKWGSNALIDACYQGNIEIVHFILDKADRIEELVMHQNEMSRNALHIVCERKIERFDDVVARLLEIGGTDICRAMTNEGHTPLGLLYLQHDTRPHDIKYIYPADG